MIMDELCYPLAQAADEQDTGLLVVLPFVLTVTQPMGCYVQRLTVTQPMGCYVQLKVQSVYI